MQSIQNYIFEKFNDAKNGDEFYTRLQDIENGLKSFDFANKVVYCNCDNPKFSNFYKYFKDNFNELKLRKLYATYYDEDPKLYTISKEIDGIQVTDIKSGRFQDNVDILKKADIIVTNPPYSDDMPIELVKLCLDNKKDFIIVGPLHLAIKRDMFNYLKDEQVFSIPVSINKFDRPDGGTKNAPSCWWTNIYIPRKFKATKKYDTNKYPKYDNYDAIDCKNYEDLPNDYDGVIGTSYRFICYMNKDEWELVDYKKLKLNGKTTSTKLLIKRKIKKK